MRLHELSISQLRQALARGELSAAEIAAANLSAIEQQNPRLNAWTTIVADRMRQQADRLDRLRREGQPLPPLAGVPYAVKNLFDVAGHPTLARCSAAC